LLNLRLEPLRIAATSSMVRSRDMLTSLTIEMYIAEATSAAWSGPCRHGFDPNGRPVPAAALTGGSVL